MKLTEQSTNYCLIVPAKVNMLVKTIRPQTFPRYPGLVGVKVKRRRQRCEHELLAMAQLLMSFGQSESELTSASTIINVAINEADVSSDSL